MDLKKLVADVKKIGRFKDSKQAKSAINSVFLSLRQRNVNEDAGGVKNFFTSDLRNQLKSQTAFSGVHTFLFASPSEFSSILLANLRVRVQCSFEDVCDSQEILSNVFYGLKQQLTTEESVAVAEEIGDGELEKLWRDA